MSGNFAGGSKVFSVMRDALKLQVPIYPPFFKGGDEELDFCKSPFVKGGFRGFAFT
jgi:hypothetical protein